MKKTRYNLVLAMGLLTGLAGAQEFKTSVSEFQVDNQATISIEASYTEIEIEEWNRNRVEVQGVMHVEGLSESEAKGIFDAWRIETENKGNEVVIRAKSNRFGNDYFFIHNDKYMGNVVIDIPKISSRVIEALDSIHFVLPEITEFPDIDYDFDFDMDLDYESFNFDYEAFKNDSEYLKEWQERNKEQLDRLKAQMKKNHAKMSEKHKELQRKKMIEAREEAKVKAEKYAKEAELEARKMEKEMRERQGEIQKILEKRQKIKVKRTLKVKVPKNAKLEMDVDYCKITTVN